MKIKQSAINKLQDTGNKLTKPREMVLNLLGSTEKHLSAENIYLHLHKKNQNIGLASVYRILDLLFSLGIVYKFDLGDKIVRFELDEKYSHKKHHHHLVCNICKKIVEYSDFQDEEIKLIKISESSLEKKYNFKIDKHIIQFFGYCKKCNNKK